MNMLITGAAGSIGKHLVKAIIEKGDRCRCLVRKNSDVDFLQKLGAELIYGDICFPKTIEGVANGVDYVYHLAAVGHVSSVSLEAYKSFLKVNVEGTRNLLKECKKANVKKFIHFSSTAAMGLIKNTIADENTICCPKTPYQKTKYQSEQVVMDFYKKEGLPVVILRPCMVYGEGCKGEYLRIFKYMRKGIFPKIGGGKKLTPLIYIHNLIPAVINAAQAGNPGSVYLLVDSSVEIDVLHKKVCKNLGVKAPYIFVPPFLAFSLIKIYEVICKILKKNPKINLKNVKSTVANRIFNCSKAKKDLSFRRVSAFDQSLKNTIKWAKEEGYL